MLNREKIIVISDILDDSVKSAVPFYEVMVFPTFVACKDYLENTPESILYLFVSERDLPFTNTNIIQLKNLLKSPFLEITGNVIYLLYPDKKLDAVREVFKEEGDLVAVYNTDITADKYISFIKGQSREDDESNIDVVVYRERKSEYLSRQGEMTYTSDDLKYISDEEELSDVGEVGEPIQVVPTETKQLEVLTISGDYNMDRYIFMWLVAQYKAQECKVLIMEDDMNYSMLTEVVTKSETVRYKYYDYKDLMGNSKEVFEQIRNTEENLIVIGSKGKCSFNYNMISRFILSNVKDYVDTIILTKEVKDILPEDKCIIVCNNNIPTLLRVVDTLTFVPDPKNVLFVGAQTIAHGKVNINSKEMSYILNYCFKRTGYQAEVISITGTERSGDTYDLRLLIYGKPRRKD